MPVALTRCSRQRPLVSALLASLMLHGLLLSDGFLFAPISLVRPPAALQAVLRETRDVPVSVLRAAPLPLPPAKGVAPAVAVPVPAAASQLPSNQPAPLSVEMARPVLGSGNHAGVPMASHDGVDADAVRQYRLALAIAARRYKYYPSAARAQGQEGLAEVVVQRLAAGTISTAVQTSSGFAVLDEQAVAMLAQAALTVPPPNALLQRDFRVLVPVQFSLTDE